MKTVWKFPLSLTEKQRVEMPLGAQILDVQLQNSSPCLWAIIQTGAEMQTEMRVFETYGTGDPLPNGAGADGPYYVATYQLDGFVWHVFEARTL